MKVLTFSLFLGLLLFCFGSCQKDDDCDAFDWYNAIIKRETPYAQIAEPDCFYEPFNLVFLNDPYYYKLQYDTANIAPLNIRLQDNPVEYMVYDKREWNSDDIGLYSDRTYSYLYNLKTGENTKLGISNGVIDIGRNKVVYSQGLSFVVYDIQTREAKIVDGNIYEIDLNSSGDKVFFESNLTLGQFEKRMFYICNTNNLDILYSFNKDQLINAHWLNDSILIFTKFILPKLYSFNVNTGITQQIAEVNDGHFASLGGISDDARFVYGNNAYVKDLVSGSRLLFNLLHEGDSCENRNYVFDGMLPDGQIIVPREYVTLDTVNRIAYYQTHLHLFNADGTNERRVELKLP